MKRKKDEFIKKSDVPKGLLLILAMILLGYIIVGFFGQMNEIYDSIPERCNPETNRTIDCITDFSTPQGSAALSSSLVFVLFVIGEIILLSFLMDYFAKGEKDEI